MNVDVFKIQNNDKTDKNILETMSNNDPDLECVLSLTKLIRIAKIFNSEIVTTPNNKSQTITIDNNNVILILAWDKPLIKKFISLKRK